MAMLPMAEPRREVLPLPLKPHSDVTVFLFSHSPGVTLVSGFPEGPSNPIYPTCHQTGSLQAFQNSYAEVLVEIC